jgi:Tol biopolymer transport system component
MPTRPSLQALSKLPSKSLECSLRRSHSHLQTARTTAPQFSPDGKKIVFASNRTGTWELWTAFADGSNQTQLTDFNSSMVGSPRWSPDGKFIIFAARPDVHAAISIISAEAASHVFSVPKNSKRSGPDGPRMDVGCSSPPIEEAKWGFGSSASWIIIRFL